MNGRVYDYNLGRFLSVDPLIHMEGGSQGINPYSYVMNNPLAGTDPTGYDPEIEKVEIKEVKTERVAQTGSRIKREQVTQVSGTITTSNGSQDFTANYSSGNLSGYSVSDIGSQKNIAQNSSNQTSGTKFVSGYSVTQKSDPSVEILEYTPIGQAIDTAEGVVDGIGEGLQALESGGSFGDAVKAGMLGIASSVAERKLKKFNLDEKIDNLRNGKDVRVKSVEEARKIIEKMPELQPGPGNLMPGLRDRRNTYRGDLINKSDPLSGQIHPVGKHKNQPHFNLNIIDDNGVRQKPAIFIDN